MTSLTPQHSRIVWEATARGALSDPFATLGLQPTNIVARMDIDRVPYCSATLTLDGITEKMWKNLEPRRSSITELDGSVRIRARRYDADGNLLDYLGRRTTASNDSEFWLALHTRTARRGLVSGTATVELATADAILDDRRRIATDDRDTGATTVYQLVTWTLLDVFGSYNLGTSDTTPADTPLVSDPERSLMKAGETFNELIEPELQAIDFRLFNYWGRGWNLNPRDTPPMWPGVQRHVTLSTYSHADGAPEFADPIVFDIEETVSRDGDYADGLLVEWDTTDTEGGILTRQRSGNGDNTRGRVVTYKRPQPGENAANVMVARTRIRGQEFTLTCAARFDIVPGMNLTVYTRAGVVAGSIRACEWDMSANTMTIRMQSGRPLI